jgi:hypothetical protein
MQERDVLLDTPGGDQPLRERRYSPPFGGEDPREPGAREGQILAADLVPGKEREGGARLLQIGFGRKAAEQLGEHQIRGDQRGVAQQFVKQVGARRHIAAEIGDPDRGVDQDLH